MERVKKCLMVWPNETAEFIGKMKTKFGYKLLLFFVAIYGLGQGLAQGWFYPAQNYFFKDELNLGVITANAYATVTHIPWTIKPLYGILSDNFPLFSNHRTNYIIFSSGVGIFCWVMLASIPPVVGICLLLLVLGNYSLACPDVMSDAVVAEKSKLFPNYASDLQAFNNYVFAIFAVIGTISAGFLIEDEGSRLVFGLISITSILVFLPSTMNYLDDKQKIYKYVDNKNENSPNTSDDDDKILLVKKPICIYGSCLCTTELLYKNNFEFSKLGLYLTCLVVLSGIIVAVHISVAAKGSVVLVIAIGICLLVHYSLRHHHNIVSKVTLFLFLREVCQPNVDTAFFYWYTDASNGPHFSPEFVGIINTVSYLAMFIGIYIYNTYLRGYQYRTIFTWVQIVLIFTNLLDFLFVTRANTTIGIPDKVFILGDSTIGPVVKRLYLMPMFVLSSKVCPDGSEATLYAIMMSLSNYGYDVGTVFGTVLLSIFHVSNDDWSGFKWVLLIKSILRIVPIILIKYLVPKGAPDDDVKAMKLDDDEDSNNDDSDIESKSSMGSSTASENPLLAKPLNPRSSVNGTTFTGITL